MGVVFSGMFALGLVLYTSIRTDVHLDHILFGNILGVAPEDVLRTLVIALVTVVIVLVLRRDLLLWCFDETQARAAGLRVRALRYGFLALLSLAVVGALEVVGIILVIALLIAPGAIAFLLTDRFECMLILSVVATSLAGWLGVTLSFALNAATAPTVVLVLTVMFVLAFAFAPKKGLLAARRARLRAART